MSIDESQSCVGNLSVVKIYIYIYIHISATASVAQWYSTGLVIQRTRVRFPAGRPWRCIFRNWSQFGSYDVYRKPPNISPGLIFVRKHFLVGLYMGGSRGGLYTDNILC